MARTKRSVVIISLASGNEPRLKEYVAAGSITPGALLEFGASGTVQAHSDDAPVPPTLAWFADVNPYTNHESGVDSIDTPYTAGVLVRTYVAQRSDEINALLKAAGNVTAIGTLLESAGNGTLQVRTTGTAVARALEVVNNSAGGTPVRIRVEVL